MARMLSVAPNMLCIPHRSEMTDGAREWGVLLTVAMAAGSQLGEAVL